MDSAALRGSWVPCIPVLTRLLAVKRPEGIFLDLLIVALPVDVLREDLDRLMRTGHREEEASAVGCELECLGHLRHPFRATQ